MILIRYVLRSLNVFNGLLLMAVAAVVYFAMIPVLNPVAHMPLPLGQEPSVLSGKKAEPLRNLLPGDYAMISEQNLFHPERKFQPGKPLEKAVPRPDVFLYGTLITSEGSFAFVGDRKSPPPSEGRDRSQRTVRKGASLGGYMLEEVEADRIVLVKGDDRVVVMLSDQEKRRGVELPTLHATQKTASGGLSPLLQKRVTPLPQPAATPRMVTDVAAPPPSPMSSLPSPQTTPRQMPGIGASGVWPPTKNTIDQTRQKLQDAQRIRAEQLRSNSSSAP